MPSQIKPEDPAGKGKDKILAFMVSVPVKRQILNNMIENKCHKENKAEHPMMTGGGVGVGGSSRKEGQKGFSEKVALIRDLKESAM